MSNFEIFLAPTEFKFLGDAQSGLFEGYGSVFGILDSHKDVVAKGAFDETLAEHKRNNTMPGMYVEHSVYTGGDPLPVGAYTEIVPDDHGLHVKGKISALDTDHGRRIRGLMADKALDGLSIAFAPRAGGARMGKKQGEPRRTLTSVNLYSVDIVRDPSNNAARINELKSTFARHLKAAGDSIDPMATAAESAPDIECAIACLATAIVMQDKLMSSGSSYYERSVKDIALLMERLQSAYEALTGDCVPDGLTGWCKSTMAFREIRATLVDELGLSRKRADDIAKRLFGSLPRDEGSNKANSADTKTAFEDIAAAVSDFSLPKF